MTTQKMSYADIKNRKKPVTKSITIALDPDLATSYEAAKSAFEAADNYHKASPDSKELKAAMTKAKREFDAALEALQANSVEFWFKALSRELVDEVIANNPPTKKQKEEAEDKGEEVQWNADTFPPALIAASLYEPDLTEEEVFEIWDSPDWNQAELMALFFLALEVNQTRKIVDIKKG